MRLRTLFTTGATAVLIGAVPVAAMAQDTTNDPDDLDRTFVPSAPGDSAASADTSASAQDTGTSDDLPNTGGGLALAGTAAIAGAAALRGGRR